MSRNRCWWFCHDWEKWSEPYFQKFEDDFGCSFSMLMQQSICKNCGKMKRIRVRGIGRYFE